jgi:hypothetical protein
MGACCSAGFIAGDLDSFIPSAARFRHPNFAQTTFGRFNHKPALMKV